MSNELTCINLEGHLCSLSISTGLNFLHIIRGFIIGRMYMKTYNVTNSYKKNQRGCLAVTIGRSHISQMM